MWPIQLNCLSKEESRDVQSRDGIPIRSPPVSHGSAGKAREGMPELVLTALLLGPGLFFCCFFSSKKRNKYDSIHLFSNYIFLPFDNVSTAK
jgi:hypothetical protein